MKRVSFTIPVVYGGSEYSISIDPHYMSPFDVERSYHCRILRRAGCECESVRVVGEVIVNGVSRNEPNLELYVLGACLKKMRLTSHPDEKCVWG